MQIALDAMGGDRAPEQIVQGAVEGLQYLGADDRIFLTGPEDRLRELLAAHDGVDGRIQIVQSSQVIEMCDSPVEALRQKRDSSLVRMVELAVGGKVDAVISAGNTGACVAACQMKMRLLPGVSRPGIAVIIPTFHGPVVMCDVGANVSPKAHHLHQYALMSTLFSREMCKVDNPRVALLSIGEEEIKGTSLVRDVHDLMRNDKRINFTGNIEGRAVINGVADVVVCDGFVGNVVLKLIEGLAEGLLKLTGRVVAEKDPAMAVALKPMLEEVWRHHDYSEYGGAPLLGVDGICIICHGSSGSQAIKNAVREAARFSALKLNEQITGYLTATDTGATANANTAVSQAPSVKQT